MTVRLERFAGAGGVVGVAVIAAQFILVGLAPPGGQAFGQDRSRWEWVTLLRIVGGLGIIWFTAGLATRLDRPASRAADSAAIVYGAGLLWGFAWLLSALFNSAAILLANSHADVRGARFLGVLGAESVLVLTPILSITFLAATGAAVLASPTFPRRYAYMSLCGAGCRVVLAIVDWYGTANVAMRIMDFTLLWVVVTGIHLLGATRPTPEFGTPR
jgi:hypothetical protein